MFGKIRQDNSFSMKKIIAGILAVILAFAIAFGDRLAEFDFPSNGLEGVFSLFKGSDRKLPKIPKPLSADPEVANENLSYSERLEKADYYYKKGFSNYAINEYVKASQLQPDQLLPYQRLMQIHFEIFNYDKSRLNAEYILKINPDNDEAQYYLVLNNIRQSRFDEAIAGIENLKQSESIDTRLIYLTALLQIAQGDYEPPESLLRDLVALNDFTHPEINENANKILSAFDEFNFAEAAEKDYLSILLIRSLNEVSEYELAIYKLKEVLKNRSDLRDAWILLGFAYLNLEKYTFAITAFERAYELDPEWPATQYFLGITYSEISKKEDAIIYLNYALSNGFEPSVVVHQKLADLYMDTENYQKAVNAYEQVLEFNSKDINGFVRPIWIYLDFLNNPQKALALAELAMVNFPDQAMSLNLLGWAQGGNANYIEAEKNLKLSIEKDPNLAAAHYNLAQLYEEQERFDEAMDYYKSAYQIDQVGSIGNLAAKRFNALIIQLEN